jgi:ubiquinone/menaquinone biosynthesis C-methylase UbiE
VDEAEFDKFADEYRALHAENIRASGETPEYFAEYKVIDVARELARVGVAARSVLDFGAGVGYSVPFFARHLPEARVTCLDVSRKSLEVGAARHGNSAEFCHFDGRSLPRDDETFDIAFASCVFHHIAHEEHVALLEELLRVLKPGGWLFVFEHNPFNPLTRHAVDTCEFDENARLVRAGELRARARQAGFSAVRARYRIFFPRALRALRPLEAALAWLPLGAQYYVCARKVARS